MINKLSALLFANNVIVKAALAGYHCVLSVGSFCSVRRVEVTVFYDNISDETKVRSILLDCPLTSGSFFDCGSCGTGSSFLSLYIPFEDENND